jgi:flavin reductase (DIM6/NTAB) family NADH-FMN oxidoreductase RutF
MTPDRQPLPGRFVTGVTVVTPRAGDLVRGVTVNSFTSVSLDPPLVQVRLDRRTRADRHLATAAFCVNVLAAGQRNLALHFSDQRAVDHADLGWDLDRDTPWLTGCIAYLSCILWACYDGGDHRIHLGLVRDVEVHHDDPFVFHDQRYQRLHPPTEEKT